MTTNAIDRMNKIVASDSRWSVVIDANRLAYVDDTGFDKLSNRQFHAMVFAGDGVLIERWKNWFAQPELDIDNMPPVQRLENNVLLTLCASLVAKPDCAVMFHSGWWLHHREHASFSGSGATFACDCYMVNGCGRTAISSAAARDPATGGALKFIELASETNNLSDSGATLQDAINQLQQRGFVMDTNNGSVTSIRDIQASTTEVLRALASGERSVTAPTGLPTRVWTEHQKDAFKSALKEVARQEAELRR